MLVHQYEPEVFEVEFVTAAGETHAMVTLNTEDFRDPTGGDLVCVRGVGTGRSEGVPVGRGLPPPASEVAGTSAAR